MRDQARVNVRVAALFPWASSEAATDRAALESMGARSNLTLPIETGPDVRHLIVNQPVQEEREWPDVLTTRSPDRLDRGRGEAHPAPRHAGAMRRGP